MPELPRTPIANPAMQQTARPAANVAGRPPEVGAGQHHSSSPHAASSCCWRSLRPSLLALRRAASSFSAALSRTCVVVGTKTHGQRHGNSGVCEFKEGWWAVIAAGATGSWCGYSSPPNQTAATVAFCCTQAVTSCSNTTPSSSSSSLQRSDPPATHLAVAQGVADKAARHSCGRLGPRRAWRRQLCVSGVQQTTSSASGKSNVKTCIVRGAAIRSW